MQGSLDSWLWSYDATLADLVASGKETDEGNRYAILRAYHSMADIMAATCLASGQLEFDKYEAQFRDIVAQSEDIALSSNSDGTSCVYRDEPGSTGRARRAWPDVSWVPPLYYTALKCRVRDVRMRAVELMEQFWRFEIIWDVGILDRASLVAREVIEMEETGWEEQDSGDGNYKKGWVEKGDKVRLVPGERRFDAVEMVLSDDGGSRVQIVCKKFGEGEVETVKKVYDERKGVWIKMEG